MIARRSTVVAAPPADVWRLLGDPSQLARWWPGVTRVEEATRESWTQVLGAPRGKTVRADYTLLDEVEGERLVWRQEVEGSPFERILASALTTVSLRPSPGGATEVEIAIEQRPRGWARFAPLQFRAACVRQVRGAIEGLEALFAEPGERGDPAGETGDPSAEPGEP